MIDKFHPIKTSANDSFRAAKASIIKSAQVSISGTKGYAPTELRQSMKDIICRCGPNTRCKNCSTFPQAFDISNRENIEE